MQALRHPRAELAAALRNLILKADSTVGDEIKCNAPASFYTGPLSGDYTDGRQLAVKPDISATLGALRRLLPVLIDRGFHFERVTDILCPTTSRSV